MNLPYRDHECRFEEDGSEPGVLRGRCIDCGDRRTMLLPTAQERGGDARAQLWARVYADELKSWTRSDEQLEAKARVASVQAADAAAADFDAHYLGAKR